MSDQYDGPAMAQTIIKLRDELRLVTAERDRAQRACEQISVRLPLAGQITALKAQRDALKAAAEKGTEYVLAQINQDLKAERDAAMKALEGLMQYAGMIEERCGNVETDAARAAIDAARSKP